ncbi:hypothetical protein AAGQ96_10990 [Pantoea sp. MBD-2R]|uniref:hypothetical protein n=1 Tax=Pantoea sp. MBD-2R TaxID=3141540 RepID=UPI003183DF08
MAEARKESRPQTFAHRLDAIISQVLSAHRQVQPGRLQIVMTGGEIESLSGSLKCLEALHRAGYQLRIAFSHSASQSAVKAGCQLWNLKRGGAARFENPRIQSQPADFILLFLPSLSLNSLMKIASGLRDNMACEWVFYALGRQKKVIATLGPECTATWLPSALRALIARHIATLQQYGVVVKGSQPVERKDRLIALRDVRLMTPGQSLYLDRNTLITPAARDELRRWNISVIQGR